jgi:hypothetical protein
MIVLLPSALSSCSASMEKNNTPTKAVEVQTKIVIPSATALFNPPPVTLTPTSLGHQSLTPTLTSDESESYLLDYFENDGRCKLPCWLGATPGETAFTEFQTTLQFLNIAHSQYNPAAQQRQKITLGGLDFKTKEILNDITLFVEPDGKISEVEGVLHTYLNPTNFAEVWDVMDIRNLLLSYGTPSSISIMTDYDDVTDRVGYSIGVFHIDQGFAVYYNGGADYQPTTNICPSLKDYQLITIGFTLQAPPFQEEKDTTPTFLTELDTGLSTNDLYDILTDENKICIEISSDKFK